MGFLGKLMIQEYNYLSVYDFYVIQCVFSDDLRIFTQYIEANELNQI